MNKQKLMKFVTEHRNLSGKILRLFNKNPLNSRTLRRSGGGED